MKRVSPLVIVLGIVLLDMLGIGILIPVIPQLLANPSSTYYLLPSGWSEAQGLILLGFLTASFPFAQFFATPILGQLSDKFGRKPILAISLVGTTLSYVLFIISMYIKNLPLLFFSRFFDGLTGGNIAVALAVISDVSAPTERAKNFGLIGATFGVGFILGPYLGGILSDPHVMPWFNATTPFYLAALLSSINTWLVCTVLPETNKHQDKDKHIRWSQSFHNIIAALKLPGLTPLLCANFFFQGGFTFFTTFAAVFFMQKFGASQSTVGNFFAFIGVWIVITQGFITRKVSTLYTEHSILRLSLLATALFITLQALTYPLSLAGLFGMNSTLATSFSWIIHGNMLLPLLVVPFFSISNGLTQANMNALISKSAGAGIQGEIMGINSSVQALAQTIPAILSGYIAAQSSAEAPILVAGSVLFVSWIVFIVFVHPKITTTMKQGA